MVGAKGSRMLEREDTDYSWKRFLDHYSSRFHGCTPVGCHTYGVRGRPEKAGHVNVENRLTTAITACQDDPSSSGGAIPLAGGVYGLRHCPSRQG